MKQGHKQSNVFLMGDNRGLSLIETSIIIILLGLLIAPLFAFISLQEQQEEVIEDSAVNERILSALSLHLRQQGSYPCPANPALKPGDALFGDGTGTGTGTCTAGADASDNANVRIGALPIKQLNLPFRESANLDGWKYVYAVTETLTNPVTYNGTGAIRVVDEEDNLFLAQPAHFVVINPGRDGKGVYTINGTVPAMACGSVAQDSENCNGDSVFREADRYIQNAPNTPDYYDDIIAYTLASEESTLWQVNLSSAATGLNISNRNLGNVGIGTSNPESKLHIQGGDVRIQADGATGGNVVVERAIQADGNIESRNEVSAG